LQAAIIVGTIIMIALACQELAGPNRRLNSAAATVLAGYLSLPYLSFRPATLAIFLLAICAWLLLRDRRLNERSRSVWLIVPITALLVNIHLTAAMVPLWVACLFLGALLERRGVRRYALMLALTLAACCATPMLAGLVRTAWHYRSDIMVTSGMITEMQPIYATLSGKITLLILVLLLTMAAVRPHRWRMGE